MKVWFAVVTFIFIFISVAMVLIILVQRPQGGGLAGAFGGAGGASTETVFGGRVGDALTWATVVAFMVYLVLAIGLTRLDASRAPGGGAATTAPAGVPFEITTTGTQGDVTLTPISADDLPPSLRNFTLPGDDGGSGDPGP